MNKTNAKHGNQALAIILSMTLIFAFFPILSLPVLAVSSANSIDLMDTVTSGAPSGHTIRALKFSPLTTAQMLPSAARCTTEPASW